MTKIKYIEYLSMFLEEDVDEEKILEYSVVTRGDSAFDLRVLPDPEKVDIPEHIRGNENAMAMANGLSRSIRHNRFMRQMKHLPSGRPVIVSEGDSWVQFPLLIDDIIDHLSEDYYVYSVGAAGDTARNMIYGPDKRGGSEYLKTLLKWKDHVRAFVLSAAGNDIIGEDPVTKVSALQDIVKPFNGDANDVVGHIDYSVLRERLEFLRSGYQTVIEAVRSTPGFEALPIIIHGYDYVFPYPWDEGGEDPRNPSYAKNNEWLGEPLDNRGIRDRALRRNILKTLIDQLYALFGEIATHPANSHVFIVDCRDAMPSVSDWNDEIHGTSDGFGRVAERFRSTLSRALSA